MEFVTWKPKPTVNRFTGAFNIGNKDKSVFNPEDGGKNVCKM